MPSPKTFTTKQDGFTLVELLVAMGIFMVLASLGLFISADFYRSYAFRNQSATLVSVLERARTRSLTNINNAPHGVHIASTSYTIFQGATYATRDASYDESFVLDSGITAHPWQDITFSQLSGMSTASGSVIISDTVHTATISLNYEGRISW